jgi:hypothetical protein
MTESEFLSQMSRLISTFGKVAYSTERATLVWRLVKDLPAEWFEATCDEFIGSMRQAPLIPDLVRNQGKPINLLTRGYRFSFDLARFAHRSPPHAY